MGTKVEATQRKFFISNGFLKWPLVVIAKETAECSLFDQKAIPRGRSDLGGIRPITTDFWK
jgi:hypothetical protein